MNVQMERLIDIANGGEKFRHEEMVETRHSWFFGLVKWTGRPRLVERVLHYNLEEQLGAIERLGRSSSEEALNYINTLLVVHCNMIVMGDAASSCADVVDYSHPNAKGELSNALASLNVGQLYPGPYTEIEPDYRAKDILKRAQENLRKALRVA